VRQCLVPDLLGVMYRRFPLTHEIIREEFGAIKHLNLSYALAHHCLASLMETNVLKFFFVCHFLFYNFVTIRSKDEYTDHLFRYRLNLEQPHPISINKSNLQNPGLSKRG